jgi:hypothetical protein
MTGGMSADFTAMGALRASLHSQGQTLAEQAAPLRDQCSGAVEAAGEFGPSLGQGMAVFALSWTEAFGKYAECLGILADHVGRSVITLATADQLAAEAAASTVWDVAP